MNDWPIKTIADCADDEPYATQIGPFGKALTPEAYQPSGVPLLRGANVNHGRFHDDDFVFISEADADRLAKFESFPGDVLLVHKGTLGKIGLMPTTRRFGRYIMGNSMLRVRCHPARLIPEYLYYWLSSAAGTQYLLSRVSQVGVPQIQRPLTTLREAQLPVPPLAEQLAIVGVLGALDDKIEQNQRTAQSLERLARETFRAWFVDFEPVKAKAAGATAFPAMPQPVFDALPTRFVESDIGPVPEGWDVTAVSECTHLTMGQSPPSEHYNVVGVGLPFHQGVTDYGFRFPTHRIYCSVVGRIAEPLDVLLSVRAPVGRINVADRRLVLGRGLAGFRHLRGRQSFLLHQLAHVFAEEDAVGDGTIYKAVTKQFLSAMPLLSPADDAQAAFELIARPLDELILSSEMESRKLTAMRDYLLPKLLTGEAWIRFIALEEAKPQ